MIIDDIIKEKQKAFKRLSYNEKRTEVLRLLNEIKQFSDDEIIKNLYENILKISDIDEKILVEIYNDIIISNAEHKDNMKKLDMDKLKSVNNRLLEMREKEKLEISKENIDDFLDKSLSKII